MELRKLHFPYCLMQTEDSRYILLNRQYKPLGESAKDWITYETHPTAFSINLTPAMAKQLSWNGSEDIRRIYLYSDGCIPTESPDKMNAYLSRLAVLMKLKTSAE